MVSHQAAILVFAAALQAQTTGVHTYRSSVDQTDQPFAVFLPKNDSPGKRYPLLVSLHGAGGDHRSGLRQVVGDEKHPRDLPFIVVAPYGRGSMGYLGLAERDVIDVVIHAQQRFPVDHERIYLTGVSMGASGSYHLVSKYPKYFAAAIFVCGKPLDNQDLALPSWILHGEKDDVVPVQLSRDLHRALPATRYTEFPGAGHNIASQAYSTPGLFAWLLSYKRPPLPFTFKSSSGFAAIHEDRVTYVYVPQTAAIAREAANWAGLRGRPAYHPVLLEAQEVQSTAAAPTTNLFVFGPPPPDFPLRLNPASSSTHGLLQLRIHQGRLIASASGLPWWSDLDLALDRTFRWQWLSLPYRLLQPLPTWVLYRRNLNQIIAQGDFDEHGRLRPKDREILNKTGLLDIAP
jgi:predicted esterase